MSLFSSVPWEFRAFALSLLFYHVSEYAIAATYNRATLSRSSWLLSTQYCVAMVGRAGDKSNPAVTHSLKPPGLVSSTLEPMK
jgi:hypothetical protein